MLRVVWCRMQTEEECGRPLYQHLLFASTMHNALGVHSTTVILLYIKRESSVIQSHESNKWGETIEVQQQSNNFVEVAVADNTQHTATTQSIASEST